MRLRNEFPVCCNSMNTFSLFVPWAALHALKFGGDIKFSEGICILITLLYYTLSLCGCKTREQSFKLSHAGKGKGPYEFGR